MPRRPPVMPPPPEESREWEFPTLRGTFNFEDDGSYVTGDGGRDNELYDVKFYPYNPPDAAPVFAALSKKHILMCRLLQTRDRDAHPCEIFQVIRDVGQQIVNCSSTWTKDMVSGKPYLCVAGMDAKVKICDVKEGTFVRALVGHGGEINDMATSPVDPEIIATASEDTTVRIWSLKPAHERQPCIFLLGGEGHLWNLLTVAFHETGRYVLSGGHDQIINLWTLPDVPEEASQLPIVLHYPHFSTNHIHHGLVDCVQFYGDIIISRSSHEDIIVLWRIEGFSSKNPPPPQDVAPANSDVDQQTRSAFAPPGMNSGKPQYTRLLQFRTPGCGAQFYMRFGLYDAAGHHPMLAFCNGESKIHFWDLVRMTSYYDYATALRRHNSNNNSGLGRDSASSSFPPLSAAMANPPPRRPEWLTPIPQRKKAAKSRMKPTSTGGDGYAVGRLRENSDRESAASVTSGTPDPDRTTLLMNYDYSQETIDDWEKKYSMENPYRCLNAHKIETCKDFICLGRQVAWSPDGEWCIVGGSNCRIIIMKRWESEDSQAGSP